VGRVGGSGGGIGGSSAGGRGFGREARWPCDLQHICLVFHFSDSISAACYEGYFLFRPSAVIFGWFSLLSRPLTPGSSMHAGTITVPIVARPVLYSMKKTQWQKKNLPALVEVNIVASC